MFEFLMCVLIATALIAIKGTANKVWAIIAILICCSLLNHKIQQQINVKLETYCATHPSGDICAH